MKNYPLNYPFTNIFGIKFYLIFERNFTIIIIFYSRIYTEYFQYRFHLIVFIRSYKSFDKSRIISRWHTGIYWPRFELVALNKPRCTVHGCIENSNQPHQRRNFACAIRIPHSGLEFQGVEFVWQLLKFKIHLWLLRKSKWYKMKFQYQNVKNLLSIHHFTTNYNYITMVYYFSYIFNDKSHTSRNILTALQIFQSL